jgi:CspA family cold shock protein
LTQSGQFVVVDSLRFGALSYALSGRRTCFPCLTEISIRRASSAAVNYISGVLTMSIGTVKWFNAQKGYGFLAPEGGGKDVFVHISAVERAGMDTLREGQRLNFELETGRQGKVSAVNLRPA